MFSPPTGQFCDGLSLGRDSDGDKFTLPLVNTAVPFHGSGYRRFVPEESCSKVVTKSDDTRSLRAKQALVRGACFFGVSLLTFRVQAQNIRYFTRLILQSGHGIRILSLAKLSDGQSSSKERGGSGERTVSNALPE